MLVSECRADVKLVLRVRVLKMLMLKLLMLLVMTLQLSSSGAATANPYIEYHHPQELGPPYRARPRTRHPISKALDLVVVMLRSSSGAAWVETKNQPQVRTPTQPLLCQYEAAWSRSYERIHHC